MTTDCIDCGAPAPELLPELWGINLVTGAYACDICAPFLVDEEDTAWRQIEEDYS